MKPLKGKLYKLTADAPGSPFFYIEEERSGKKFYRPFMIEDHGNVFLFLGTKENNSMIYYIFFYDGKKILIPYFLNTQEEFFLDFEPANSK